MILQRRSQVISELLAQAESAFYETDPRGRPAGPALATSRASHLITSTKGVLTAPPAWKLMESALDMSTSEGATLETWLPIVLDAAIALVGADRGNIRILDPRTGGGRLVAYAGFVDAFVDRYSVVTGPRTPCGRAAHHLRQIAIDDLTEDACFSHDASAAGFASVQSTPLRDHTGRLIGVMSTHWDEPRRHPPAELQLTRLQGDLVGEDLSQWLIGSPEPMPRLGADIYRVT